jgi:predicted ester cyclase
MKNHANLIREFIDDVLNHGNLEATGEYFHEDVVELARFPSQGPGLNGLKDVLHRFHAAFPNRHWLVEEQVEEGDKVVGRFVWTGTLRAEFLCVPATVAECPFWG